MIIQSLFHSKARVFIIAGLLVIAPAIFYFLYQNFRTPKVLERKELSNQPLQEVPQTNPFEEAKTNPFKDIKTNPFE